MKFKVGDKVKLKDSFKCDDVYVIEKIDDDGDLILSCDGKKCNGFYNPSAFDLIEKNDKKLDWMI